MSSLVDLKAQPGRCEEASPLSWDRYIPCNAPAVSLVDNGDARPYRMCAACADHNVTNRRATILRPLTEAERTDSRPLSIRRSHDRW